MPESHRVPSRRRNAGCSVVALGTCLLNAAVTAAAQEVFSPPDEPARYVAVPARDSMIIDGRLDEAVWQRAEPITEFVRQEPVQGQPISYPTTVRVAYDETALHVAAICYQSREAARVQNLQRDFSYDENDLFGIAIDGFMDHRNAVVFQTTPYGSQRDMEVIDSSELNDDWDARRNENTRLYGLNLRMALSPQLQFSTFFQHNCANETSNWNVRLVWEYRPLSYLCVVYNRNDIDAIDRVFRETGEQLIAKFTYLFEMQSPAPGAAGDRFFSVLRAPELRARTVHRRTSKCIEETSYTFPVRVLPRR